MSSSLIIDQESSPQRGKVIAYDSSTVELRFEPRCHDSLLSV